MLSNLKEGVDPITAHRLSFIRFTLSCGLRIDLPLMNTVSILKDLFIVSKVTIEKEAVPTHDLPWSFDTLFRACPFFLHFSIRADISARGVELGEGHVRIQVIPASASKCPRCWTFAKVASESVEVCDRCEQVLAETANY